MGITDGQRRMTGHRHEEAGLSMEAADLHCGENGSQEGWPTLLLTSL